MEFKYVSLDTCSQATDTVVVIDVLRAFSTAAYAFGAGATSIALVSAVDEAFALRRQMPDALLMGEVEGLPIKGFDFGNSPAPFVGLDLSGRRLIQRTSTGTQGVVRSQSASQLLASSFCCAGATARYIQRLAPRSVTFVIAGWVAEGYGDEDLACANYLEALLRGQAPDSAPYVARVYTSMVGRFFVDSAQPGLPATDLDYCGRVDAFDFAMPVDRQNGLLSMTALK